MVVAGACASGLACGDRAPDVPAAAYQPFYPVSSAGTADPRGTLKGDYRWAASATSPEEAAARWQEFLKIHQPPDGEYQDGFQRNYVRSAQYELMRAEYLLGHVGKGDALLRELEDARGR